MSAKVVDFRERNITRGKQCHFIMIKDLIIQEDIITLNLHYPIIYAQSILNLDRTKSRKLQIHSQNGRFS